MGVASATGDFVNELETPDNLTSLGFLPTVVQSRIKTVMLYIRCVFDYTKIPLKTLTT